MSAPHDVEWTPEKVTRFWDDFTRRQPGLYFSAQVKRSLADFVAPLIPGRGTLLDLGCGDGILLAEMQHRGYQVLGVDSSLDSLRAAAERIGVANVRRGSVTQIPVDAKSVSALLLIETIEHVLDDDLEPMMAEIMRVLKNGGPLVITTPNAEDLDAAMLTCPDCAARFHPMQHVRSWTADSLTTFLRSHGFGRVQTYQTRLAAGTGWQRLARKALYRWRGDRDNLIAVART